MMCILYSIRPHIQFMIISNSDGVSVATDSTDDSESTMRERRLLMTLRMFYVKSPSQVAPTSTNDVTCRLFLPARTGKKSFESMNRTMDRIDAWLRATGE